MGEDNCLKDVLSFMDIAKFILYLIAGVARNYLTMIISCDYGIIACEVWNCQNYGHIIHQKQANQAICWVFKCIYLSTFMTSSAKVLNDKSLAEIGFRTVWPVNCFVMQILDHLPPSKYRAFASDRSHKHQSLSLNYVAEFLISTLD